MRGSSVKRLETHRSGKQSDGRAGHFPVRVKRAYEAPTATDGVRVLVDRLWPRGLGKTKLAVDCWLKDVAPSAELRRWYGHRPERWRSFAAKYREELSRRNDLLNLLDELRRRSPVTLLYGARDTDRNNAVVLRDVLEERSCTQSGARQIASR